MDSEHALYVLAAYGLALILLMGLYSVSIVQLRTLKDRWGDET